MCGAGKTHRDQMEHWRVTLIKFFSRRHQQYNCSIDQIEQAAFENFLSHTCGSSNGYFNSARKQVSALFGLAVKQGLAAKNPLTGISSRKHTPEKNKAFTPDQLRPLLDFCRERYFYLYVAFLMEFSLVLRPHTEIRLLSRGMFNRDLSLLKIPDGYTKGSRGRDLPVGVSLRALLIEMEVPKMLYEVNIFSGVEEPFNRYYFSTQWSRFRREALKKGLMVNGQTLYSMRHSAALNVYDKTKSIKKVQKLLDHSNIRTTFAYMRSHGIDDDKLDINDMPNLEDYDTK
ncbi:MAG: tyrosine-type recombinase/integrase [Bacteroidales bacterium]|jgi:integrase